MSTDVITITNTGEISRPAETAMGGGIQGAESLSRETALWNPAMGSPDMIINRGKPLADARGRDLANNDGLTHGAVSTHKDSIVGAQFRLNSQPKASVLARVTGKTSFDETWSEEFSAAAEDIFGLIAESESCWLDASRAMKLTDKARLAVAGFMITGETVASAEWFNKDPRRPCMTATRLVSPARLSNPGNAADTEFLRRGVQKDKNGRAIGYHFQVGYPRDMYGAADAYTWQYVPAEKPWGRKQVLHILERGEIGQSRGVADMVATLSSTKMGQRFEALTLQKAVIAASYAAALESELPPDGVYAAMGQSQGGDAFGASINAYMGILQRYFKDAGTMRIDGAKIPVLPPGTKFTSTGLGSPDGLGTNFQAALHRHTAAALGVSYEEYSKNWEGLSYSTARASAGSMERFMRSRKKVCADGVANFDYQLWLEEAITRDQLPLPRGVKGVDVFYIPLAKEAFSQCSWVSSGSGQIDELKETQAAILRVGSGLSTWETEIARLGGDWRVVFLQQARERALQKKNDLQFTTQIARPGGVDPAQQASANDPNGAQSGAGQ